MNLLLPVILAPDPCILSSPWLPSLPPQFNLLIKRGKRLKKELCRKVDSESKGQFYIYKNKGQPSLANSQMSQWKLSLK